MSFRLLITAQGARSGRGGDSRSAQGQGRFRRGFAPDSLHDLRSAAVQLGPAQFGWVADLETLLYLLQSSLSHCSMHSVAKWSCVPYDAECCPKKEVKLVRKSTRTCVWQVMSAKSMMQGKKISFQSKRARTWASLASTLPDRRPEPTRSTRNRWSRSSR